MTQRFIFIALITIIPRILSGQVEDTTKVESKSLSFKEAHSPHKASIYSLCLPGLGQAYNRKYWKIPLVYGCLGGSAYFFWDNRQQLNATNDYFKSLYANNEEPTALEIANRNALRVNRDIAGIAFVLSYVLQVVDATVDAHFYRFNINETVDLGLGTQKGQWLSMNYKLY